MQSSPSLSSLASSCSSHSSTSTYGSRSILDLKDLHHASARCRSSIVSYMDHDHTLLSPPPPPPRRRQSHIPAASNRSGPTCRQLFRSCLSSAPSPLSIPTKAKLSTSSSIRERYFAQLCQSHRLLLVLNDYDCQCGCHFSMREGSFVVLYDALDQTSSSSSSLKKKQKKEDGLVTVISGDLICSKIPMEYVCDVEVLRERVRRRQMYNEAQSFDL